METGFKYKTDTYQGLLQMLVYLVARGYFYYCPVDLPEKKKDKWDKIDRKLIEKYQTEKSKWQRHRLKVKKVKNFFYLRWCGLAFILHTEGEAPDGIIHDDTFHDIRKSPMTVKISILTTFVVRCAKTGEVSVKLHKDTLQGLRDQLAVVAKYKDPARLLKEFDKINGYPAYAGIIAQKKQLARHVKFVAMVNNMSVNMQEIRINTKRKIYKVWTESSQADDIEKRVEGETLLGGIEP